MYYIFFSRRRRHTRSPVSTTSAISPPSCRRRPDLSANKMASSIPEESSQMGAGLYAELAWLPRPPEDFYARCRSASEEEEGRLGLSIQALARYGLDENQLIRLAKLVAGARQRRRSLSPLVPFRLGIVSNATSRFIVPALVASAARHGIALECSEANFDQVVQEVLSPASAISRAQPDAVLIAIDHRGLPLRQCLGDAASAEETVEAAR